MMCYFSTRLQMGITVKFICDIGGTSQKFCRKMYINWIATTKMSYNQRECFNNKEIQEMLSNDKQHFNFKTLSCVSVINGLLNVIWILPASQNKMVKKYTYEILLLEFDCPKHLVLLLSSDVFSEVIYETWFSWMRNIFIGWN